MCDFGPSQNDESGLTKSNDPSTGTTALKHMLPVNFGASSPNSLLRTVDRTPSAPTIRSASNSEPSAKIAAALSPVCLISTHADESDATPAGNESTSN